jgi:hypothetical protein
MVIVRIANHERHALLGKRPRAQHRNDQHHGEATHASIGRFNSDIVAAPSRTVNTA